MTDELDIDQRRELLRLISAVVQEMTHDCFAARIEVADKIVDAMQARGWTIVPPPEHRPH